MQAPEISSEIVLKENWKDRAAMGFYFIGLLFLVFFSVEAIAEWPNLMARTSIAFFCLSPLLALALHPRTRKNLFKPSKELFFISSVFLIGIINTLYAENYHGAVKGMGLFLITGAIPFWAGLHLFPFQKTRRLFYWTCALTFFLLCSYGVYQLLNMAPIADEVKFETVTLFQDNPIPAGSILILLSVGPLSLIAASKTGWTRNAMMFLIGFGIIVLLLIGQRGLVLALLIMVLVWAVPKMRTLKFWLFFLGSVLVISAFVIFPEYLPDRFKGKLKNWNNIAYRAESLIFGSKVFMENPVWGLGVNTSYENFPYKDYQTRFLKKVQFEEMMRDINTFDNTYLTMAVEMGGLMVLVYSSILILALHRVSGRWSNFFNLSAEQMAWLSALAGFAVHSITFDSFRYPSLNFMIHALLALMICQKTKSLIQSATQVPINT